MAGGVTGVGLKAQAAPGGSVPQDRSTGALKPFWDAIVQLKAALSPWTTLNEKNGGGEQATVNAGTSTFRLRFALRTRWPLVPVTWKLAAPPGVLVWVLTVRVLVTVPLAGTVTAAGLKLHEAPPGSDRTRGPPRR